MLIWERVPSKWQTGGNENTIFLFRAKVPGGWFVSSGFPGGEECSTFFYPDPEHEWDDNSLP